ncbi:hypothetical protein QCA50_003266 [Cerrena zonata]|uniref:FYVE-type domain-containing protein n=1 Tax=Cerrena zonata TaxID=2478898 RepID=A0AAW0GRL7_9APHY
METPPYVPYQAYRSKRHSKTPSNPQVYTPNVSPPPQAKPPAIQGNGLALSEPAVLQHKDILGDPEKTLSSIDIPSRLTERPVSMTGSIPQHHEPPPPLAINVIASQEPTNEGVLSDSPATVISTALNGIPSSPTSPAPTLPSASERPQSNGKASESGEASVASSSTSSPGPSPRPSPAASKRVSTFRHVPLRPASARPPAVSSPLRPAGTHARTSSNLSSSSRYLVGTPEPRSRPTSTTTTPLLAPYAERALPTIPLMDLHQATIIAQSPDTIHRRLPSITTLPVIPPTRSSSLAVPTTSPSSGISPPGSQNMTPASALSPASSSSSLPTIRQERAQAPYSAGFQPKGCTRYRTDEFLAARKASRDNGRIERTRLERRLEKLINLHFPHPDTQKEREPHGRPGPGQQNRRQSSFFDLTFEDLRTKSVSDLWKGAVTPSTPGGRMDTRASEQAITPWENDADVSQCPICRASFHPITNRKHHCRLCGKIICSLPIKYPQRPQPCSLLFVADPITGAVEEVKEGVDYGVRKRTTSVSQGKGKGKEPALTDEEKFLKGVRICNECRPVILRKQYLHEFHHIPVFSKLYDAFIALEKEIEEALPQFQELVLSLSNEERPAPEASAARKRLLDAFGQYDALAKRIQRIPCPGGPGSSQSRVQAAIIARANNFLQKNMFPLQALPKPKPKRTSETPSKIAAEEHTQQLVDPDSDVAHALQPLLEQEALLESFVEEAKARRKFEDVKTLKSNLAEIRIEIDRMMANADERESYKPKQ